MRRMSHEFNRLLVMNCRVGQGPPASDEVVRGTLLRLANNLARATAGVRPELAELVVQALNERWPIAIRTLGSVGQADLAPMGDVAAALIDRAGFQLEAGEGMAMVDNNSFSTSIAALAVADCTRLADALDVAGALEMEAFVANPSILHAVLRERPYAGLQTTAGRLRELLAGSRLWQPGVPRNLQDPLTFRCLPQLHGALRDALTYARGQLDIELNAAQSNPLVDVEDGRVVSVGCFDVLPLAAALDFLRIALAPVLTSANERVMKLLHAGFSGLAPGLAGTPRSRRRRLHRVRRGRTGDRSRGAAAGRSGVVRDGELHPGRGHRGPDDDGSAGRPAAGRDGRSRRAAGRDRAGGGRPGRRPACGCRPLGAEPRPLTGWCASASRRPSRESRCRPTWSRWSSWCARAPSAIV